MKEKYQIVRFGHDLLNHFVLEIAVERDDFITSDLSNTINQAVEERKKIYQKKKEKDIVF